MRTLKRNKQKMYYAEFLIEDAEKVYDKDGNPIISYIDEDGNIYYEETGSTMLYYQEPVLFYGNIAMSSGEAQAVEFGVDVSAYDAVLVMNKSELPITETSLIWFDNEPTFIDAPANNVVDGNSADYKVIAIKPSLNETKYILKRIVR